ncbi:MAG: signal peptide peptidase SppA [Cytophagales bacterium]|nr:signal peptide peptidase SppA [Cytophagales bacterium]
MSFLKSFLASCLGTLVALGALLFIGITVIASLSDEKVVSVSDESVLHLRLEAPIAELEVDDPLADVFPSASNQSIGLLRLKEVIKYAKNDSKIKGIYLNTSMMMTGMASLQELRASLLDFKESGKWIVSYADAYTEGAYYLATVADKVYMYNEGEVEFNGLATEVMFFKKMFDKLEIKPQIFRVGDFKSAVEPFMRESLSEENKLQLNSLLTGIHTQMLRDISDSRKIPFERLKEISDKMLVQDSRSAVTYGLIDSLFYDDQIKEELRSRLGIDSKKKVPLVKYSQYKKSISGAGSSKNEIAVIVADGDIFPGKGDNGVVGSTTIVDLLRKARTNDRVKAIVLRINSPGGVFQAADMMWREIELAAAEKPVIASMSDYAASGGYYLAMACDTIVAQPTTITGSIGVFTVLFDLSKFLDNKLGITIEEVKTGEVGELITVTRSLTDTEKAIWQKQTDKIYETFTRKAAEGRSMPVDQLKKIASGRVWLGSQAKDNGLADVLGGFDDAVALAAKAADIGDEYRLRYYPQPKPLLERLMGNVEDEVRTSMMKKELGENYQWYRAWERAKTYQGVQARMPVEFKVK